MLPLRGSPTHPPLPVECPLLKTCSRRCLGPTLRENLPPVIRVQSLSQNKAERHPPCPLLASATSPGFPPHDPPFFPRADRWTFSTPAFPPQPNPPCPPPPPALLAPHEHPGPLSYFALPPPTYFRPPPLNTNSVPSSLHNTAMSASTTLAPLSSKSTALSRFA